jgi:hypothetical protein
MAISYVIGKSIGSVTYRERAKINYLWAYVVVVVLTVGLWYERVQDEGGSPKDHSANAARAFSLMLPAAFCGVYVRGKEKEDAR